MKSMFRGLSVVRATLKVSATRFGGHDVEKDFKVSLTDYEANALGPKT